MNSNRIKIVCFALHSITLLFFVIHFITHGRIAGLIAIICFGVDCITQLVIMVTRKKNDTE